MDRKSVVLGFSGGIDSCASARWLIERGYRVVAVTIDTMHDNKMLSEAEVRAKELGIEWLSDDATELFRKEIIDYFTQSYRQGLTPAPCTRCNPKIKWQRLQTIADSLGIEHIATGHYFRIEKHDGRYYVAKGADSAKDQSYYLWGLQQETLQRALTPMAEAIKSEVKAEIGNRSESMGICFLAGRHYTEFLASEGIELSGGAVLNGKGEAIGEHNGIARYTIGQRRGEGIPEGLRVVDINASNNTITVDKNERLFKKRLYINECNIVSESELTTSRDITIKIRGIGRNPELPVSVKPQTKGYVVECDDPVWAPAKGQPLVFYRGNLVIGGGIVVDFE